METNECNKVYCRRRAARSTLALVFLTTTFLIIGGLAQTDLQQQQAQLAGSESITSTAPIVANILPPPQLRPNVHVNVRDWTHRLSEELRAVSNKTSCLYNIERFFEKKAEFQALDPVRVRDNILSQINTLLAQHRAAVSAIVGEAERLAVAHTFVKDLRVNYTDVHRLRNELEPLSPQQLQQLQQQMDSTSSSGGQSWSSGFETGATSGNQGSGLGAQFTSINGGTPVPGPPEWQTPLKSIVMHVNENFGEIPVNTSMSAVHLPLPIYAGLPEIMNGISWTERLDGVFKRNLAQYMHVHHQYYGDHLGFLRTFPAHKWRIPRTDPDLFDARTRPWYVAGASSPKDVVILVDSSGSMTGLRREIAKGVVFEILDTLTSNDYFSVMRFSETVTPIGLPKCNLRTPKLAPAIEAQCNVNHMILGLEQQQQQRQQMPLSLMQQLPLAPQQQRENIECRNYRRQWEQKDQYLREHPNVMLGKNGSYLTDDIYLKTIVNITHEIEDAYLLPATSRNIRYLKSNFSMPTAGIANFTHALMSAFELLQAYNRTSDQGAKCNQAIFLITDGAIKSHDDIFNRYNYPNSPTRVFTYMIGREVGDITHTKAMACSNRGYYTHVINLGEVREQVLKYLPVMARPLVLEHYHPTSWTYAYGDETHQVLTDWVLETKRRERARIMLNEERERLNEANSTDVINIELTNIPEYDELPMVDEELKNRIICEDNNDDLGAMDQSLHDELDPLGYNDLACHWTSRRADLLTSVVKPVFDNRNTTLLFERVLYKNIWTERETHVRNAQLLGVAAVDLRIADMIKVAPSHLLGPNGYAILIGHNGFVMHHPDLRALLEDPFDKQSKILKPYFNAVDLTHIEQVHHRNESDLIRRRNDDMKLFKLREAAVRRQVGFDSIYVKRAVDCRRRLHIRQQAFYYGPIKETPFSFMIALPQNYGLNRLVAKLELNQFSPSYLKPSAYELWTVHPEYKYCDSSNPKSNTSVATILELMDRLGSGLPNANVLYDDLTAISGTSSSGSSTSNSIDRVNNRQSMPAQAGRIVCDKELFPSLLFDAAATYEQPDTICGSSSLQDCDRPSMSAFSSFYRAPQANEDSCASPADEMRSKLANIYGLEMSFLATRSGLTRVKVFDLSPRIKKLADLFIQRHNKAVDEAWYSRTVDWNMRFHEDATIITVPYNAYIRLVAKLRQRITQRHPALNDTRANCDPLLDSEPAEGTEEISPGGGLNSSSAAVDSAPDASVLATPGATTGVSGQQMDSSIQNDEPISPNSAPGGGQGGATGTGAATASVSQASGSGATNAEQILLSPAPRINYSEYSSFDFLDLLANSSVHVSATQSVIANKATKQRSPVAVSGLLYDYATFARRFLNATSLNIRVLNRNGDDDLPTNQQQQPVKVEICPHGECPTKCGQRNDTIDCLLVDNNGFIVVGEELPHIGRPLTDYDENLMQSLVERRVFHQVVITDYQAICTRNDQFDQQAMAKAASSSGAQVSSSSSLHISTSPFMKLDRLAVALLSNFAAAATWLWSSMYSMLLVQTAYTDVVGQLMQWQRSPVGGVDAQSAIANQSLLALLPNKTYLRPCEKTITLYETRPIDPSKLVSETPEYFVTKCGCSGWYVYDAVPKTNLIMLIVNTTSACRKCEPTAASSISNFVPVIPLDPLASPQQQQQQLQQQQMNAAMAAANKTAEDQVCAMLQRDSQLYVRKQETCYSYHPEEAQIHICGGAQTSAKVSNGLLLLLLLLFVPLQAQSLASCATKWRERWQPEVRKTTKTRTTLLTPLEQQSASWP